MGCGSSRVSSLAREAPCGGCKAVLSLGGAIAPASPHSSPIHAAFTLPAGPAASSHSSANGCSPPPKPAAAAFSNPPTEQPGAPLASASASAATCRAAASGIQYGISPQDSCKHETEAERLAVLRALHVRHQPSGPRFGSITAVLRGLFQLPVASVYLLEEDEVLVVPDEEGISPWEAHPRCESACKWVTGQLLPPELLIIEDLSKDLRCLLDFQPRSFPASHYQMLAHMAELVVRELEAGSMLMWNALALEEARSGVRRLIRGLDCFTEAVLLCDVQAEGWPIQYANTAAAELIGLPREQVEHNQLQSPRW
ncbi:hypothetical protein D9Q98_005826 [Chlorella vulgaris]|uniref:PAS domain-containing protein n=1 Tax=Chlorella vulgaris TaxID=3077 RepID=A0A9D4Z0A5_CHLVU|nr:hypothetical protein D9Q98_005826 [Chlorella vulgaris]